MSDLDRLKGIGESTRKKLAKLGIFSIRDLVYHFPRRFIDRRKALKIADLVFIDNEDYHSIGHVIQLQEIRSKTGKPLTTAIIKDETSSINVIWFNSHYVKKIVDVGDRVIISGLCEKGRLINPKIRKYTSDQDLKEFAILEAIYPETKSLSSKVLANLIKQIFDFNLFREDEILSPMIMQAENLMDINSALRTMHFPQDIQSWHRARERIAFDEIYRILLEVKQRKEEAVKYQSFKFSIDEVAHTKLMESLPFKLTDSQVKAIQEIYTDLQKSIPMHRLLNGDVGSGKTIVAAFAAMQAVCNHKQVIFLAPTSILASQHHQFFEKIFQDFGVNIHLITSNTKSTVKKLRKHGGHFADKEIFIGTHALLFNIDLFNNVGLVIIDEQHKFGVKQRETLEMLRSVSNLVRLPHVLSMSATPIPRTLALTLYGDLDVSILYKPSIRKRVITKCIYDEDIQEKMYEWIRHEIRTKKYQVYVVCPLIEESEKSDIRSAIQEYDNLRKRYPEFNIALLHGKMKGSVKDKIIEDFKEGKIDILVSTSVVEVGIDNPNAVIMIVEGADRFGLAQLHQIRGRVGRSDIQSYCFLKTTNNIRSPHLEFFAENHDGFVVAEYDLQKRGPGEVYGYVQSGIPKLKVANILDIDFIKRVKQYL